MGLVNAVVPLAELEREYVAWAREMAALSPLALRLLKSSFNAAEDGLTGLQQLSHDATLLFYMTEEGQEGRDSYKRRRAPGLLQVPATTLNPRIWLMAARPRTLPAAIAPVLVGSAAAGGPPTTSASRAEHSASRLGGSCPDFRWGAFVAALVGSIFIQIGTNLANDYSDAKRGADTADRLGPVRVTSSGLVAPRRVLYATWLAFGVAVVAGIYLATVAGWVIIAVGVASIAAGVLYTGGPRPYGYAGMGELFVFLFFGLVAVNGSYYVQLEELDWLPFWLSVSVGLLSTAILVVNNIRDIDTDRRAGKRTLAVRLGRARTRSLYESCVGGAFVVLAVGLVAADGPARGADRRCSPPRSRKPLKAVLDAHRRAGAERRARRHRRAARSVQPPGQRRPADRRLSDGVTEVELVPLALPFERPYVTARGTLERREMYLVRLRTDEGIEGLGEAVPLALRGGADMRSVFRGLLKGTRRLKRADLSDFAGENPLLRRGRRLHPQRRRPAPAGAGEGGDRDGDLRPRRQGLRPTAVVAARRRAGGAGALQRDPGRGQPQAVAAEAERWAGRGFDDLQAQARRRRRRRPGARRARAVGPDARIRVDANGAWSVDEALGVLRMIEPLGIELVEQPVADAARDGQGHRRRSRS